MKFKKVVLGISGGVDSAVAGYLLKQQGHDVRAVFMLNWKEQGSCNWEDDLLTARRVTKHLNIPLEIWDFAKEYKDFVFNDFIELYKKGQTPNPDVFCNKYIKFGAFYDRARKEGADFVATGHYAQIRYQVSGIRYQGIPPLTTPGCPPDTRCTATPCEGGDKGGMELFSAVDKTKDQSDFLYQIKRSQLKHIVFPIGGMLKSEVKELAKKVGLPNWNRPESMGVCFIGEMNMKSFLAKYIQPKRGDIVTPDGTKLGEHDGVWYYTLGQREGLNIGGTGPYFVVQKDVKRNTLTVAKQHEAERMLEVRKVVLTKVNLFTSPFNIIARSAADEAISGYARDDGFASLSLATTKGVKVLWRDRHLSPLQPGTLRKEKRKWVVEFNKPKRSVTPGQSLVMYDLKGERVIGGGVIAKAISK